MVAAAESLSATLPMTLVQLLEEPPGLLPTTVISQPVVGETTPIVTESVPVSVPVVEPAPVVAEAPAVTTTQNITPSDTGVVPVDANAPVAPNVSEQNQQLFLPIITNVAALAGAALGSPGGIAALVLVVLLVAGSLRWRRRGNGR